MLWQPFRPPPHRTSSAAYLLPSVILLLLLISILVHPVSLPSVKSASAVIHSTLSELDFSCPLNATENAFNITVYRNESFAPVPLPKGHSENADALMQKIKKLNRGTVWKSIENITFEGELWEPEGLVRLGEDRYVVSAGEYIAPTVKDENGNYTSVGAGFAHLVVFDGRGKRIADASISKKGSSEYHIGGLDFDGQYIWGTIGEYRPDSSSYVVRASPHDLKPENLGHYGDHLGGIIYDQVKKKITCLTWGGRQAATFQLYYKNTTSAIKEDKSLNITSVVDNPSYFADYQDCKLIGRLKDINHPFMLCSGVTKLSDGYVLGGLALVDIESMLPVHEIPVTLSSSKGTRITMNPMDVAIVEDKLRVYWLPDQHESTLYVYEAQV